MAPTTRAATKRLRGDAPSTNTQPRKKTTRKRAGPDAPDPTTPPTSNRCCLLELPPELRNQIYEFAFEDLDSRTYAPRPIRNTAAYSPKPWAERSWTFFGLMHTCKQIRTEYRPLWLRGLTIRTTLGSLPYYIKTFLPDTGDLQHAPRLAQIEWDHGMDDYPGATCDLMHVLRLRAHTSCLHLKFIPNKLAAGDTPADDLCWYCIEAMEAEERGDDFWENSVESCTCAPDDMSLDDWETYQYDLIRRTGILHDLIRNSNEKWLEDIREEKMTITCRFGKAAEPITFRILCKDRFCEAITNGDATAHAESAWSLLQQWGIFDLPSLDQMSFVVAFEGEEKIKKGRFELISSEVREVRVGQTATE